MINTDITLEQAKRNYGCQLVPWILDNKDLRIINKTRREAKRQTGSCMNIKSTSGRLHDIDEVIRKRLWDSAVLK